VVTSGSTGWSVVTATARGSQHDKTGLPNQDAVTSFVVPGPVPGVVAAVADGHGGARYVRSDIGSRAAVDIACRCAAAFVARASGPRRAVVRLAQAELVPTIVERWRAEVLEDAVRRPFTAVEHDRAGVTLDDDVAVAYGSTLLLAIATESWVLLVQIGDGDIVVSSDEASASTPVPGDARLAGGQTTSLCLPTAAQDARIALLPTERASLVLLSSDGYGNSFAEGGWRDSVARDVREQIARLGLDGVGRRLPGWLAESAHVGGDDVSLAVLARRRAPKPAKAVPVRATTAALVAAAVLFGGLGGWFLRGAPQATSAPSITVPSPDPSTTLLPDSPPSAAPASATTPVDETTTTTPGGTTTASTTAGSPSTTSATADAAAPGAPMAFIAGAHGELVVFPLDAVGPAVRLPETAPLNGAASLTAFGFEWRVQSGALQYRALDRRQWDTLRLSAPAGSIAATGERVWVLSADASTLVAIDPTPRPPRAGDPLTVLVPADPAPGGNGQNGR
jgi:hypothetical protein